MRITSVFFIVFLAHSYGLIGQNDVQNISIQISGIENSNGEVGIALFRGEDGFPMDFEKAKSLDFITINDTLVNYKLTDVLYGEYAVTVFHDEDLNREVETNFIGMPKEGVGVSNNPKARMGAPRYEDCNFHTDTTNKLIINMRYIGQ